MLFRSGLGKLDHVLKPQKLADPRGDDIGFNEERLEANDHVVFQVGQVLPEDIHARTLVLLNIFPGGLKFKSA